MTGRLDLDGKVVVITGGTGGIATATTRELLRRGARVAITDIDAANPAAFAEAQGADRCWGVTADVRDRAEMDRAVERVIHRFGRIDVVIANAGILTRAATFRATPAESIDRLLSVNVNGVVNTVAAALEPVIEQQGHIVLLSSIFAYMNGMGAIPYAMSKSAVEQLGRGLQVELASLAVTTTIAYFSLIQTPMIAHGVDADSDALGLLATLPAFLLKRLTPEVAARGIVGGIERRSPQVMLPARWKALSAMRGLLGPTLDARLAKDRGTQAALAKLDGRRTEIAHPQPEGIA